jgi:putative cobalt transporter subunit CbtA
MMKAGKIIALSMLAGLLAGGILAGINMALVQPHTAILADIEMERRLADGEFDEDDFGAELQSIYFSQQYGSLAIGVTAGAMMGGAFVASRIRMDPIKVAILIAGIAWFVLYVIPAVKYPPSPEAAFNPDITATNLRLLAGYTVVSGLAATAIAVGFRKVKRKEKMFGAAALYLAVVAGAFFAFPDYQSEDDLFLHQPVLNAWRSAISLSITTFWFSLGTVCGLLWKYGNKRSEKAT